MYLWKALSLLPLVHNVVANSFDDDLMSFVTLPGVRALKFNVEHHDRTRLAPGYWFVAPYSGIGPEAPTQKYQQFQVGPYIYDNDGKLVWAGSPVYDNRNTFDFKPVHNIDDDWYLSWIVGWKHDDSHKGNGVVMDHKYQIKNEVQVVNDLHDFNMHEFTVLPGGKTALACTYRRMMINLADFGRPGEETGVVLGGFVELDTTTSQIITEWDSRDKIAPHESEILKPEDPNHPIEDAADYVHINSVDKNAAGDYLISMRFTSTIYLISGADGHIIWRLGGKESSFIQDFVFSQQHDASFVESDGTRHVISILNNGGWEGAEVEPISSALVVELDTSVTPGTAKVIRRVNRPDKGMTKLRGSAQVLPNDNLFAGWSEWGYQSEHAPNGDVLMTARFASERFSTYRTYKSEFIGRPKTPPAVVAAVYGTNKDDLSTTIHVSWNGATEVASWKFYARSWDRGTPVFIGSTNKTDFETLFIANGYMDWISVEGIDRNDSSLGSSDVHRSKTPMDWKAAGFRGADNGPSPENPAVIYSTMEDVQASTGNGDPAAPHREPGVYSDAKKLAQDVHQASELIRKVLGLLGFIVTVSVVGGVGVILFRVCRRRRMRSYLHVPQDEGLLTEQMQVQSSRV
ncbi:hypothetical protein NUU61_006995 [Penicillium alfredii]|uniref:ASST-domain-containing protein n=1 Tax=Penicillium alfredii TaxID=1506179 RepID=A0A9W9F280_9EURO|nr:uncharacterized protein NUU61_006995 [Penicillium alfredii]KAJ5092125.1 hypothetical protein NUU61_006995 [Penicillium alfredii]